MKTYTTVNGKENSNTMFLQHYNQRNKTDNHNILEWTPCGNYRKFKRHLIKLHGKSYKNTRKYFSLINLQGVIKQC